MIELDRDYLKPAYRVSRIRVRPFLQLSYLLVSGNGGGYFSKWLCTGIGSPYILSTTYFLIVCKRHLFDQKPSTHSSSSCQLITSSMSPQKTISFREVLQVGHSHKKPCAAYKPISKTNCTTRNFFPSNSFEASRILCESESQLITKLVT